MSLKDVPVRARLWAPDRSLPRFLGRLLLFLSDSTLTSFCPVPSGGGNARRCRSSVPCCALGRRRCTKVLPKRAALHPRAMKKCESVAQESRAAPSGDEDVRKCRPSVPCCTLGRRKSAKVLPKRAVLHPWATKMYESVAQESRAALLGDDKCGFRRRRVSFIHTSLCPAPLGDEDVRKCRSSVPCCTLGRRRCTKVSPKRAVLYPWATKKCESVAQESRAAPLGNEDVRKCRSREPCCTLGRR